MEGFFCRAFVSFNPRPRVGGDKGPRTGAPPSQCFNPRPRVGGDGKPVQFDACDSVKRYRTTGVPVPPGGRSARRGWSRPLKGRILGANCRGERRQLPLRTWPGFPATSCPQAVSPPGGECAAADTQTECPDRLTFRRSGLRAYRNAAPMSVRKCMPVKEMCRAAS